MKQMLFKEKYPIYTIEIAKNETTMSSVDAIIEFLKAKVDSHPIAKFIAIFDHMSHTKSFEDGIIVDGLIDAKNLIFCFGKEIPTSKILAVRPRSIGVCEFENHFELSLLEVPNENLHTLTESWIKEIANKK